MITTDDALTIATDNGIRVTDDHEIKSTGCAPAKRAFWCYSTRRRVQVVQERAGAKKWTVQVDTVFTGTRAQCIIEATRFCKVDEWK